MSIRLLHAADAPAYRALMLEAYANHPDAFTSSVAERAAMPMNWWIARLSDDPASASQVLGATDDTGQLVGTAGLNFESREKSRHKATLFGLYVAPAARGQGLARGLMMAALAQARQRHGVRLVQLTVSEGNAAAQRLYADCGFQVFGVEPLAMALGDGFVAKVHMWCDLANPARA